MNYLALDIGGANLKAADGRGFAASRPFPLWRQPKQLAEALRALIAASPPCDRLAVTMTGELADCFAAKAEGVRFILDAALTAAEQRPTRVYLTDGRLVAPSVALAQPRLAAASNWHALARFACRYLDHETGLLIDIGSTTTDIVPLIGVRAAARGRPAPVGITDTERLLAGELIYTGVERTPVCAVVDAAPFRGRMYPVAKELFATMGDVYLVLGDLPEEPQSRHTADGRPATQAAAVDRLARMICADAETFHLDDARTLARHAAAKQQQEIAAGLRQVLARRQSPPETVVLAGQGEFLAHRLLEQLGIAAKRVSLANELGPALSRCAPAHALAVLAMDEG